MGCKPMLSATISSITKTNSCGKEVYELSQKDVLRRFMFLGTEKGTFYASPTKLTELHMDNLKNLLTNKKYDVILDVVKEYMPKVFKRDYILLVLAYSCSFIKLSPNQEDEEKKFKEEFLKCASEVCITPYYLFMFIEFYQEINKKLFDGAKAWNNSIKKMVADWYLSKDSKKLAYLVTKYRKRNNFTHRDVLRLCHVKSLDSCINMVFAFVVKEYGTEGRIQCLRESKTDEIYSYLEAFEKIHKEESEENVAELIKKYKFTREHVPTPLLKSKMVWEALLEEMPGIALLRNLNTITELGILDDKVSHTKVIEKIEKIKAHPVQILISLKQYAAGKGFKGNKVWNPDRNVVDSLDKLFYDSFTNLVPTNKRILLALDVSGSMGWNSVCGIECMNAMEISCAMAMVFDNLEKDVDIMGFSHKFTPLSISSRKRLDDNINVISNLPFGATDISLPFTWAQKNKKLYDVVIVFTDNETNSNEKRPVDALRNYKQEFGLDTKLIVCAMAATDFTIADPNDKSMMDIAGFDEGTFNVINEFIENF